MATKTGQIDTGPNAEMLFLSCRLSINKTRISLRFEIFGIRGSEVFLVINSIEREDNSDESWNIKGLIIQAEGNSVQWPFVGYYNTQNRKGHIEFETK